MCGIIGVFNKEKNTVVNEMVADAYEEQRSRGTQGFGMVAIGEDKSLTIHRCTTEQRMFPTLLSLQNANSMLFHHRFPTSTDNTKDQTHPIFVSNPLLKYDYLVVHNGVISNCEKLKVEHEKLDFKYTTETGVTPTYHKKGFNDSESLAIEVALFIEKSQKRINTFGSAAFIALQIEKKTSKVKYVYYGRNTGNPLISTRYTDGTIMLASSAGEGESIDTDFMWKLTPGTNKVEDFGEILWAEPEPVKTITTPVGYTTPKTQNIYSHVGTLIVPEDKITDDHKDFLETLKEEAYMSLDSLVSEFLDDAIEKSNKWEHTGANIRSEINKLLTDFVSDCRNVYKSVRDGNFEQKEIEIFSRCNYLNPTVQDTSQFDFDDDDWRDKDFYTATPKVKQEGYATK